MVKLEVIWSKKASLQLEQSLKYLREKSIISADKVKEEILSTSRNLSHHPDIHSLDRYITNNDGSIRAFERYSYRISYQVTEKQVIILRVRHTSRQPLKH